MTSPAKRFAHWATNLLFTGIVIVLGISIGRNVIYWWTPTSEVASIREQGERQLGVGLTEHKDEAHDLRLGNEPLLIRRKLFHGSMDELIALLRSQTIAIGTSYDSGNPGIGVVDEQLDQELKDKRPVTSVAGKWDAYVEQVPLPMALVVSNRDGGNEISSSQRRVLSWGMAFPRGNSQENEWIVFSCGAGETDSVGMNVLADVPMPPGAKRSLTIGSASGAAVVSFQGHGQISEWTGFYAGWFDNHGWKFAAPWRDDHRGASVRVIRQDGATIDVEILVDQTGLRGLLSVATEMETDESSS